MRTMPLAAVAAVLFLLIVFPFPRAVGGSTLIPGTNVLLIEEDTYTKDLILGRTTSFRWGLVNQGPGDVTIQVNATAAETDFAIQIAPTVFVLSPAQYGEPTVSVSAPTAGGARTVSITVTFTVVVGPTRYSDARIATVSARPAAGLTSTALAFAVAGFVIFIGFAATLIFQKTKVPDLLILVALGLLLGPVTEALLGVALIPRDVLNLATPFFAALALMFILFEAGLNFRLKDMVRRLGLSSVHTLGIFVLTVAAIAGVVSVLFGYPFAIGLLLGTVVGGTSSAIVIAVVRSMKIQPDTQAVLTLESVATDVLCVVGTLAIVEYLRIPGASVATAFISLASAFSVSVIIGTVFGLLWLHLLKRLEGVPFAFMVTIAALFLLYAGVEFVGGSGAMAAFVFGLVLGNHDSAARALRLKLQFSLDDRFKQFQSELSFLVRTFFFVFLGLIFSFSTAGPWNLQTRIPFLSVLNGTYGLFLLGVVAILVVIVAVRYFVVFAETRIRPVPKPDRGAMLSMMGRGLAAAVLASLPFAIPAFTDSADPNYASYHALMVPFERPFHDIAFFVILLTVIATTVGVALAERPADQRTRLWKVPFPRRGSHP